MKYFVCVDLYHGAKISNCLRWVELPPDAFDNVAPVQQNTFLSELAKLSISDAQILLSFTAALFATAWVWRLLSKQAFR